MVDMVNDIYDWIEDEDGNNFHAYDFNFEREYCYTTNHNGKQVHPFEHINSFGI